MRDKSSWGEWLRRVTGAGREAAVRAGQGGGCNSCAGSRQQWADCGYAHGYCKACPCSLSSHSWLLASCRPTCRLSSTGATSQQRHWRLTCPSQAATASTVAVSPPSTASKAAETDPTGASAAAGAAAAVPSTKACRQSRSSGRQARFAASTLSPALPVTAAPLVKLTHSPTRPTKSTWVLPGHREGERWTNAGGETEVFQQGNERGSATVRRLHFKARCTGHGTASIASRA